MNDTANTLRSIIAQLQSVVDTLDPPGNAPTQADPVAPAAAPFGTYPDGTPKTAPAYDACRPMWEAAQREGAFDIHKFIGQGIQQGAAQIALAGATTVDQQALEDAIVALGLSPWGQAWLAHDVNAELIAKPYLKRFVGYTVKRLYDKAGDVTGYAHE